MPSTLRNARRHGMIFPDDSPNFLDLAQMYPSLLSESGESRGRGIAVPPSSMDGANSVPSTRLRSDSEPVSDESNANKFPDEEPFIRKNRRDSRIPLPPPEEPREVSDPSSNSSVLRSSTDSRRHQPWVRVNEVQDDEITPAPSLWDEGENCARAPPRQPGVGPGAFNPDPSSRNTRTMRQRFASARHALREIVREDREMIRGAMVRIGIRSEPDPENERRPTRRPEPAAEETTRREKSSRGSGLKARVTPYLSLRGGSGTPLRDQDIPPMDLSEDYTPRDQSQDNARRREQSQDNTRGREQSQDNSRPREQSQDNTRPRGQFQDNIPPREERQNSGTTFSSPRPLLSPSRQFRHSFQSPHSDERHNSGSEISDVSPLLPRPQYYRQSPLGQQGSTQPQRGRPTEYTHPLARIAQYQNQQQNNQREVPSDATARGIFDGSSPYMRTSTRHGYRQFDHRGSDPGSNARNEDVSSRPRSNARNEEVSPRPPSYRTSNNSANQNVGQDASQPANQPGNQNVSQNVGHNVSHNAGHNAGQNMRHSMGRNAGRNYHRLAPSPVLEDYRNSRVPPGGRRRDRARNSLSTFGRETGKKIKEKASKFASLGRKAKEPQQDPVGGVLEPFTPESENAPAPTAPPVPTATPAPAAQEAPLPTAVPVPTADPEPGVTVIEEAYSTNSLSRGFNMWPFNRKRRFVIRDF